MAIEPEEERPLDAGEGGPVKSFLEHLEDLRWMLIKSSAAIAVGVLICLLAGNHVVAILLRPLEKARINFGGTSQVVTVSFGTNRLGTYTLTWDQWDTLTGGTNGNTSFTPATIVNLDAFAAKLKEPSKSDLISQYLTNEMTPATWSLLTNYPTGLKAYWQRFTGFFRKSPPPGTMDEDDKLRLALTDDLNRIIETNHIYSSNRFEGLSFSAETARLIALNPQNGPDLARLNRKLLLQAYPELRRRFLAVDLEPRNDGANLVLGLNINKEVDAEDLAQRMKTSVNAFGPAKAFLVGFHVALYAGIVMASPLVIVFVGQFVFPALKFRERKYIYRGAFFAIPLFLSGIAFCYFILLPAALAASQMYSDWFGFSSSYWDAGDYIGFVSKFMLGMGLGFELPVVILILVKIGLLSYRTLSKARPYMIVINLVLGAVLTTPEVFTQVLMAIPLQVLFEISVWIAWYWEWKEKKRLAKENAANRFSGND